MTKTAVRTAAKRAAADESRERQSAKERFRIERDNALRRVNDDYTRAVTSAERLRAERSRTSAERLRAERSRAIWQRYRERVAALPAGDSA